MRAGREADEAELRRFVPDLGDWATAVSALGPLVALTDERVVGVAVRWPHPDHVRLERLAVAPDARRGGVGARLLDAVEREAIEAGVNAVRAAATGGHVPLLLGHGYTHAADGMLERRL
ncbi:GNAT family N-acetyltransferase [Amnibacterium endophyticum]|uniref:GNAT family N-acetyltransferase n=1 Tax=Amnibacterium endophyticum TaxID=2109337 RepID=A0ABW4LJD7_9MICO